MSRPFAWAVQARSGGWRRDHNNEPVIRKRRGDVLRFVQSETDVVVPVRLVRCDVAESERSIPNPVMGGRYPVVKRRNQAEEAVCKTCRGRVGCTCGCGGCPDCPQTNVEVPDA